MLPCGAGKTLVGVAAACSTHHLNITVITVTSEAVQQWYDCFQTFTIDHPRLRRVTGVHKEVEGTWPQGCIIITTYKSAHLALQQGRMRSSLGLCILDEVHTAPANTFIEVVKSFHSSDCLGLTATPVREDGRIPKLGVIVGPVLAHYDIKQLVATGYLTPIHYTEITCFESSPAKNEGLQPQKSCFAQSKMACCEWLLEKHAGSSIIIFSDNLHALQLYALAFKAPFLNGSVSAEEREYYLHQFKIGSVKLLCLSRMGDQAVDIPQAAVVIEISSQNGSRRQQAQRLGRLMRPAKGKAQCHFYQLVLSGSKEATQAPQRRSFIEEQGVACTHTSFVLTESTSGLVTKSVDWEQALPMLRNPPSTLASGPRVSLVSVLGRPELSEIQVMKGKKSKRSRLQLLRSSMKAPKQLKSFA